MGTDGTTIREELDPREIYIDYDERISNDVHMAGPEQHEKKRAKLSSLEAFYVDVHNVYSESQQRLGNVSGSTGFLSSEGEPRQEEAATRIANIERFVNMARYQIDNVISLIDAMKQRSTLAITRASIPPPEEDRMDLYRRQVHAKALEFKSIASIFSEGAAEIRSHLSVSRTYLHELRALRKNWRLSLAISTQSKERQLDSVMVSLHPRTDVNVVQGRANATATLTCDLNGHLVFDDASDDSLSLPVSELLSRMQRSIIRLELVQEIRKDAASRNITMTQEGSSFIFYTADFGKIKISLKSSDDDPIFIIEGVDPCISAAVCHFLTSQMLASWKLGSDRSDRLSEVFMVNFIGKIVSHLRLEKSVRRVLRDAMHAYKKLSVRYIASDSPFCIGFRVSKGGRFIMDGTLKSASLVLTCTTPIRPLGYSIVLNDVASFAQLCDHLVKQHTYPGEVNEHACLH